MNHGILLLDVLRALGAREGGGLGTLDKSVGNRQPG
jgi:hypothetical protein